jgi:DNA repair protein RadD
MLRDYQERAIKLLYSWLSTHQGNPCIVAPTGSGKSHIIAGLCKDVMTRWPASRILILSHVKELLQQDAEKIMLAWPEAPLGIYSAGMNCRDVGLPLTVAGIQSVRDKAAMLGFIDICIVDEAHLISAKAEGGYRTLIAALAAINPNMRVIGLTATPYRLGHGLISEHGALFDGLIEPVKIEELVARGFLAPLRSKLPETLISVDGVAKRGGEFVESELQAKVNNKDDNARIVDEVIKRSKGRKAWLFFCTGINHAYAIRDALTDRGVSAETVTGTTPIPERNRILSDYKAGRITALTNMDVLTTGFDYPGIDLIAMCRPTMSPGLYAQMAGRGMRIAPGKEDCLVLDFAGNVKRHGPITCVQPPRHNGPGTGDAPVKVCPECDELMHTSIKVCPACGYEFPAPEKPQVQLHDDDIMGNEPQEMDIKNWWWSVRTSRAKGIQMLCVEYEDAILTGSSIKEFITILHDGYARYRAEVIMQEMIKYSGANLPNFEETTDYLETVAEAMNNARYPAKIEYKKDGQYYRVLRRIWSTPAAVGA